MNEEQHLLLKLQEEAVEVLSELSKQCSKSMLFGLEEINVLKPEGPNNQERIVDELNDLMGVVNLLCDYGIIPANWMDGSKMLKKQKKVLEFMQYSKDLGRTDES